MDTELTSLSDLFNRCIYRIPDYQRGYAWGGKEIQDFWDDLEILSNNRLHYGGVITLEPVEESVYEKWTQDTWLFERRNIKPYYVVDGQQRLTTAMILLSVILYNVKKRFQNEKLDENKTVEEIEKLFILETGNGSLNSTLLFSYEKDNNSYGFYIANIIGRDNLVDKEDVYENKYTDNLKYAYDFFYKKCEELDFTQLDQLYCKLTYNFVFNRYVIHSKLDIFVTFETMNNRGKKLSQLELLKNRLIYLTTLYDGVDVGTKAEMRTQINKCWKKLYSYLGELQSKNIPRWQRRYRDLDGMGLNLDDIFLEAQVSSYRNEKLISLSPKSGGDGETILNITDLLKSVFTAKNVMEKKLAMEEIKLYISDLSHSIEIWSAMKSPSSSDFSLELKEYLYKIKYFLGSRHLNFNFHFSPNDSVYHRRFLGSEVIETSIFKLLKTEFVDDTLKIIKSLEKILFIYGYLPKENNREYEFESNNLMKDCLLSLNTINNQNSYTIEDLKEINKKLTKIRTELSKLFGITTGDFLSKQAYRDYKNISYYILLEYEIYLLKKSKNNYSILDIEKLYEDKENLNLEHIYPKNGRNKYWRERFGDLTDKEKELYKNSIGNLIIISSEKNDGLGNKDYPTKIDGGTINNPLGYKYGSYAEQYLVNNYSEWTTRSIERRGKELLDFIKNNWNLHITKEMRGDLLGISI
ncbi:DUF262 domain-containing protein [Enterococcus casseliflavus]|uniref:DUF262 domain-containing protein n=1 Tax=Enterococcus casseliflavus TaxID=37734 RepID=UPI0034D1636A